MLRNKRTTLSLLMVGLTIILPFIVRNSPYAITLLNLCVLYSILAISLDILLGLAGQVSLGHAGFVAIGAYTYSLFGLQAPALSGVGIVVAFLVSGLAGCLLGLPALRLRGHYIVLGTMAFGEVVRLTVISSTVTGGVDGLVGIPEIQLGSLAIEGRFQIYFALLAGLLFSIGVATRLRESHLGKILVAVRDDELAARATGIDVSAAKLIAFSISGAIAGLGGALYAPLLGVVTPDPFDINMSLLLLSMLIIGGAGNTLGAVLGATLLVLLPEMLRFSAQTYLVIYGILVITLVIFLPKGIIAALRGLAKSGLKRSRKSLEGSA